ncbi:MAG: TraG family conjugative transposon ATPase [Puia sp.]|nr:TraG family conjugative transposon ATPase [Puia sp.]
MQKNMLDLLRCLRLEHDCLLSGQGDMTLGYALTLPEIFTLSAAEYQALHEAWVKALRVLPPHTIVHKQDWFLEKSWKADFTGDTKSFLSVSSERFFHERPWLDHHAFLYLTKRSAGQQSSGGLFPDLFRKTLAPAETLGDRVFKDFVASAGQFVRILEDSGFISLRRLGADEIASSPDRIGVVEQYCSLRETAPVAGDIYFGEEVPGRKSLEANNIHFGEGIRVGPAHAILYTLADALNLPATCGASSAYAPYSTERTAFSLGFAANIGSLLPCNHLYNQYILVEDPAETLKGFERKRLRFRSLSRHSRENAVSMEAAEAFLQEAVSQQRLPVKAHFNILAWTEDRERLKDLRNGLSAGISRLDATPREETMGAAPIWWGGIPGMEGGFPLVECFDCFAEQACCFLNYESHTRDSVSPGGVRLNAVPMSGAQSNSIQLNGVRLNGVRLGDRQMGRPLHVNLEIDPGTGQPLQNGNLFILSGSGGGKSFFMNHLARSYYEQGTHVLIVDVGHSYQVQCMLHKGYYFTYEESHPITFNPFFLPEGEILDTEKKENLKTLLLALWKKSDETYNRSEYVALSIALQLYYEHLAAYPELFPCFDSFYEFLRRDFTVRLRSDQVKDKDFDHANFLYVLRPYYKGGEFDYLLNARENLDLLHERFIVFELDNIKDHPILFPVVTLVIMAAFLAKMRKLPGVRKFIIIEEAWKAIAREGMAEYIQYLFKTVRKFHAKAAVVTQEIEDIVSSTIIKQAILNNSDCKVLLDQSKFQNKFDTVQELLGLTEKQKAEVLSLNKAPEPGRQYKDCWISLGSAYSRVYRLEVSREEYLVYTTNQAEKMRVLESIRNHGGDVRKGIRALLDSPMPAATKEVVAAVKLMAPAILVPVVLMILTVFAPLQPVRAQIPVVGIVTTIVKKAIQAADLEVQRLQTQTIVLQDAQQQLENTLSEMRLTDISNWLGNLRDLYAEYYNELWTVKNVIAGYDRLTQLVQLQAKIVSGSQTAYSLAKQDRNFSVAELETQYKIYSGIVAQSLKNSQDAMAVVSSFVTQMSDEQRMALIGQAEQHMQQNYDDLQQYSRQNIQLSLQRGMEQNDAASVKQLYGL